MIRRASSRTASLCSRVTFFGSALFAWLLRALQLNSASTCFVGGLTQEYPQQSEHFGNHTYFFQTISRSSKVTNGSLKGGSMISFRTQASKRDFLLLTTCINLSERMYAGAWSACICYSICKFNYTGSFQLAFNKSKLFTQTIILKQLMSKHFFSIGKGRQITPDFVDHY